MASAGGAGVGDLALNSDPGETLVEELVDLGDQSRDGIDVLVHIALR
jgi:hypothetical protein